MGRNIRNNFEERLKQKAQRLKQRCENRQIKKIEKREQNKKKVFAKYYKMSYNEVRALAKKKKINIFRKTKEEIIESLIKQERVC